MSREGRSMDPASRRTALAVALFGLLAPLASNAATAVVHPVVDLSWVFRTGSALPYCHQGFVTLVHNATLAERHDVSERSAASARFTVAWQAGNTSTEGDPGQWIFTASSEAMPPQPLDWSPDASSPHLRQSVAGDGAHPAWSPTLFEDPEEPGRVWLIYNQGPPHRTGGTVRDNTIQSVVVTFF